MKTNGLFGEMPWGWGDKAHYAYHNIHFRHIFSVLYNEGTKLNIKRQYYECFGKNMIRISPKHTSMA